VFQGNRSIGINIDTCVYSTTGCGYLGLMPYTLYYIRRDVIGAGCAKGAFEGLLCIF